MGNSLPVQTKQTLPSFYKDPFETTGTDSIWINQYIDLFTKRLKENSESVEDHIALGNLFRQKKQYQKAYKLHRNLLARSFLTKEQKEQIYLEMGFDYLTCQFKDFGESFFLQALALNKKNIQALEGLFKAYRFQSKFQKAIETLEKLITHKPSQKDSLSVVYNDLSMTFLHQGNIAQAKKWYNRSLKFAKSPFQSLNLVQILIHEGNQQEAIQELTQMIIDYPKHSYFAITKLQDLYFETNQYSHFVQALLRCEQKNGSNHYVQHALGKYYEKTRQFEKAKIHYMRAMEQCSYSLQVFRDTFTFLNHQNDQDLQALVDRFVNSISQFKTLTCNGCQREFSTIPKDCNICQGWNLFDIHYLTPHH